MDNTSKTATKTLKYYTRNVYGNDLIYLASEEDKDRFYKLTGNRTITKFQMNMLSALSGVEFERVFEPEQ